MGEAPFVLKGMGVAKEKEGGVIYWSRRVIPLTAEKIPVLSWLRP